ncbi:hypothetical protein ATCC90586_009821 [Pythium insidiosum]|nr:hypothetical protein ATCC90586_009821 [Pythium insidiosum]
MPLAEALAAIGTAREVVTLLQGHIAAVDDADSCVRHACDRYSAVVSRLQAMADRGENVEPRLVQVCVASASRLVAALERYRDASLLRRAAAFRRATARAQELNVMLDDMREDYFYAISALQMRHFLRSGLHYEAQGRSRAPTLPPSAPPAVLPPPAAPTVAGTLDWVVSALTGAPTDPVDAAWRDFSGAQSHSGLLQATRSLSALAAGDAGAADRLVKLNAHHKLAAIVKVEDNAPELRVAAMDALQSLCSQPALRPRVGETEIVTALVGDLFVGLQVPAATLLAAMAQDCAPNQLLVRDTTAVDALATMLQHGDAAAQAAAAAALWHLVPLDDIKDQVADSACVVGLKRALESDIHEAARALALLAADDRLDAIIGESGCISALTRWLSHSSEMHRSCAAWAMSSLADNADNRSRIVNAGAVVPLLGLVSTGSLRQVEHAAMTLWWLTELDAGRAAIIAAGGWDPLLSLLFGGSTGDVQLVAAGALAKLPTAESVRRRMVQAGHHKDVLRLLATAAVDPSLSECLIRLLANFTSHDNGRPHEETCAALRDAGGLSVLTSVALKHPMPKTKVDVLQTLARVAHYPANRPDVIAAGASTLLVAVLRLSGAEETQQQALEAAVDALLSDAALCEAFVQADGIHALVSLLEASPTATQLLATRALADIASFPATVQSIHPAVDVLLQLQEVSDHAKTALQKWQASWQ